MPATRWRERAAGPVAIALTFVALAAWSWRKWMDVHIDFGNELYIAWQLSEGQALYLDIAHRNGPLSHYLNALWFTLFGVSIRTLTLCNLAILGGICVALWRVLLLGFDRLAATAGCLVLLGMFAFSQYVGIANYNYVTPYHHFQTHGLALCLVALLALASWIRTGRARAAALAGACLGALFLTKIELFVPALAMAGLGVALRFASPPYKSRDFTRGVAALGGAAVVAVALGFGLLLIQMPPTLALRGVLGNWAHLGGLGDDAFYRSVAGFGDVPGNVGRMLEGGAGIAATGLLLLAADRWLPRPTGPGARSTLVAALSIALFAGLAAGLVRVPFAIGARALPLTSAVALIGLGALWWRARDDRDRRARLAHLTLLAALSLGLLGKMLLAARVSHYGFVLALPASVLLVAGAVSGLPAWLRRGGRGWRGMLARGLAIALVSAMVLAHFQESDRRYAAKSFELGRGADEILVDDPAVNRRGVVVARALEQLERAMPADATLLVMPEGIGLNYWLRRRNPTSFNLFLPTEISAFGEGAMLADLEAHPPDFVALVHRLSDEFGVGPFGVDPRNGRGLLDWVHSHYSRARPVGRIGPEPFTGRGFGIVILERDAEAPSSDRSPGRNRAGIHEG